MAYICKYKQVRRQTKSFERICNTPKKGPVRGVLLNKGSFSARGEFRRAQSGGIPQSPTPQRSSRNTRQNSGSDRGYAPLPKSPITTPESACGPRKSHLTGRNHKNGGYSQLSERKFPGVHAYIEQNENTRTRITTS